MMILDYAKPKTRTDSKRARRIIATILALALIGLVVVYSVAFISAIRGRP